MADYSDVYIGTQFEKGVHVSKENKILGSGRWKSKEESDIEALRAEVQSLSENLTALMEDVSNLGAILGARLHD